MYSAFRYETPFWRIWIADNWEAITNVFFWKTVSPKNYTIQETPLLKKASQQLLEYCNETRTHFQLPYHLEWTPFQLKVRAALQTIPFWETRSYKEIAQQIWHPKAYRAVGMTNRINPIAIFIPCHRVIGSNGKLVGFAGGLDMKQKLLQHEKH
jgi:methylated-DNA-[protein]-cysteine S-methyltransferase